MRNLLTLSLTLVLCCQFSFVMADRKADFRVAYHGYQQAMSAGDTPAAIRSAERAYKIGSKLYGKDNINTAKLALNYAALLNDTEEFKKARKVLKGKLVVMESKYDENAIDLIAPLMELARAEFDAKKPDKSLGYFARIGSIVSEQDNAVYRATKNNEIATILLRRGGRDHTRPYLEAAHRDYVSVLQPEDARLGKASFQMALLAIQDQEFEAAVDYLNAALTSFDKEGPLNQAERSARELLVRVHSRQRRRDAATPHCVALGEYQNASEPLAVLFTAPLDIEREKLRGARGSVITVDFTVDAQGFVIDPRIMSSTAAGLNEAALAAISQFRYAPRFVDGGPVATTNVSYTFDFDMARRMRRMSR